MSLYTNAKGNLEIKTQQLLNAKQALDFVATLPKEIQDLSGLVESDSDKLTFSLFAGEDAHNIIKANITSGIINKEFSQWLGEYIYRGTVSLNGIDGIQIQIFNAPKPPGCKIEKYTENTTRYREVCSQD